MNPTNFNQLDELPTVFNVLVVVEEDAPTDSHSAGVPVDLWSDDGLRLWTPILGPGSVLLGRILLEQPGRQWHVADLAGQLGLSVAYTQRCLRRLAMFGWLAAFEDDEASVYQIRSAQGLRLRHLQRLHPELAARYARLSGVVNEQA